MRTIGLFCTLMLLTTSQTWSGEIEWSRLEKSDSTEWASYDIRYPSFSSPRVGPCNDSIRRFVNEMVESFHLKVRDANTLFANVSDRPFSELTIHADSVFVGDSIVSCTISVYYYTVGAAHGYQGYRSFVYDRYRGRMLRPSEFLVTHAAAFRRLIMDSLAARGICYDKPLLQKLPVDSFHISLCKSGVLVSFADYQIAAYSCTLGQMVFGWQSIKVRSR